MSFHFKMNILIIIFCLMAYLPKIKSDCLVNCTKSDDIVPRFEISLGKFKIRIPCENNDKINIMKVQDGETVAGYCETYFSPVTYEMKEELPLYDFHRRKNYYQNVNKNIVNETNLIFNCRNGTLFYNDYKLVEQTFSCLEQTWRVFSMKKPYEWCENNHNSSTFLFATQKASEKIIVAALCYNIDQMSFQTFVYNTTNLQHNDLKQPTIMSKKDTMASVYAEEDLQNFNTYIGSGLSEEILQKKLSEISKTEQWLSLANYEVSLIVQDELLMKYLKTYEKALNIIWWRNLRLGNWRRFQNRLQNYAHNNSYELYVGSSGAVQYPTNDKCDKERYLEIKLDHQNETVPAYIWTYFKSNDNLNKEFIMVGFNSPFVEYFTIEKIIFCPDICSEIPWLKEVSITFRYTYAGIMFCCSTDFLRQTHYLQGFPFEILPPPQIMTTVAASTLEDFTETNFISSDTDE